MKTTEEATNQTWERHADGWTYKLQLNGGRLWLWGRMDDMGERFDPLKPLRWSCGLFIDAYAEPDPEDDEDFHAVHSVGEAPGTVISSARYTLAEAQAMSVDWAERLIAAAVDETDDD